MRGREARCGGVARILTTPELCDRVQAIVLAYESGVVRPGDMG